MRVLLVTQYFWPENFRINDLVLGLTSLGYEVEVLTGKPNYPNGKFFNNYSFFGQTQEQWNNCRVYRSPVIPRGRGGGVRLMLNYVSHAFFSSIQALTLKKRYDLIFVYEPSPITIGIPALILKYRMKIPVYFWVQDLWPQSVKAAGGVNNQLILNGLEWLTRWIYSHCDKILIQSKAFREVITKQVEDNSKIIYYPNTVESFFKPSTRKPEYEKYFPKGFNLVFAGNIGESQDFETILEAAKIVNKKTQKVNWIIIGDGRKVPDVEKKIYDLELQNNVILLGSFPVETMPEFFAWADCLLVSLKDRDIFNLTIPSKIQSYLACGRPILASINGEGKSVIEESNSGVVAPAETPFQLAEAAINMSNSSELQLKEMGINARRYFDENFERSILLNRLGEIFKGN
jgi:glycosyltransferase involved in cell wall biosynthesis